MRGAQSQQLGALPAPCFVGLPRLQLPRRLGLGLRLSLDLRLGQWRLWLGPARRLSPALPLGLWRQWLAQPLWAIGTMALEVRAITMPACD